MMKGTRTKVLAALALAGALGLTGSPAMAAGSGAATAYTCTGGDVPSGTYSRITVTGMCSVGAGAVIDVAGNIDVMAGAMLDAQSAPATIMVGHNVTAGAGSLVGLGCQPPSYTGNSAHECAVEPEGHSTISVQGNVTATDALAFLLNGATVKGNVTFTGGGSGIPWSIKNNTIGGNLTVSGQTSEWLGVLFNRIAGNTTLTDITIQDEHPGAPGVYVVRNTIGKNLTCMGLTPGVSGGFVPGSVNVVGRNAIGQCASLV
ncbi:hypothetical protein RKE38_00460 [Phycicoccus sp. M110.8]|uniref:hypothetical protein n=1 Tax=Phycicoccus sp. M110.8 TaxID=3075433 RepID=UPI0028FD7041|nr:hypothetical protein [Phycicoccus sp. M110.8]MDU0312138.1 hypothetical protein [Phycicoccus sp. M110.8]